MANFIPHRETLARYCNTGIEVVVIGTFVGRRKIVDYCYDERRGVFKPENQIEPECRNLIKKMNPDLPTRPVSRVNWASTIVFVKGVRGFGSINEDHINIQENIMRCTPGTIVKIWGWVIKYEDNSKVDGYDYGIDTRGYFQFDYNTERWT